MCAAVCVGGVPVGDNLPRPASASTHSAENQKYVWAHTGLVVGTSSRFYTAVHKDHAHSQSAPSLELNHPQIRLSVRSPQFINAQWSYLISRPHHADLLIEPDRSCSQNTFVECAVRESMRLSLALQSADQFILPPPSEHRDTNGHPPNQPYPVWTITILGDNDFYSQPRQNDAPLRPFNRLNTSLQEVHKTGLGSSAAMVTSLCSAILIHFTPSLDPRSPGTKLLLHNLSQYVHSLAQGKVGSGFDVSAAIYGTHVYRRFSPSCLDGLLGSSADQLTPDQLRLALDPKANRSWVDPSTAPAMERFCIPKCTTLILADVDAGSHTPSMVGQVLKWKNGEESAAADQLWKALSVQNEQLKLAFEKLEQRAGSDESHYVSEVLKLSTDPTFSLQTDASPVTDTDDVRKLFIKVSSITKRIRQLMKKMGTQSHVPIEPDGQTDLLDQCEKRPGVIGSGVPGAGGYDAIWILMLTPPGHPGEECPAEEKTVPGSGTGDVKGLQEFLEAWPGSSVRVLSPASWVVGGGASSTADPAAGGSDDGIKILDSVKIMDCLKSQRDLFP
ncbi:hypothetical protein PCANC_03133 [Puccinia coronata f. sp. avenae]|uniref:phosphomevalonate kinase n=1 Tax=Puccinia coronata f. sp. avenae TaxID=200324 RepID=A0A2N5W4Q4_9BASI|nr:hypothetical protein PCANC_03133 [Puccinia coronata f. sp. avenae]